VVRCVEGIEKTIRPLLERFQNEIFRRQARMAMGPSATMHEPMEIQDSNEENKEEGVVGVPRIIEVVTKVS
jgi:hypothetical protein